jgi:hypothetical protein
MDARVPRSIQRAARDRWRGRPLVQDIDGAERRVELRAGEAVVNPRNVWHTADVTEPCRTLFVTPGQGTEHKPR